MKRQLQGIALILFSIFLILFYRLVPWFPLLGYNDSDITGYASIIVAIVGLVRIFKDDPDKQA